MARSFRGALDQALSDTDARRAICDQGRVLAMALVNEGEPRSALRARPHGTCLRYKPAVESLELARRGDAAALRGQPFSVRRTSSPPRPARRASCTSRCSPVTGPSWNCSSTAVSTSTKPSAIEGAHLRDAALRPHA